MLLDCASEGFAAGAGRQRGVDEVGGFGFVPGEGVERVLERRAEQDAWLFGEYPFRAVAVMDVEVDDCDAFEPDYTDRLCV